MFLEFLKTQYRIKKLYVGNGQFLDILGAGTYDVDLGYKKKLLLTEVLYASDIIFNLISIYKLIEYKFVVCYKGTNVYVLEDSGTT